MSNDRKLKWLKYICLKQIPPKDPRMNGRALVT